MRQSAGETVGVNEAAVLAVTSRYRKSVALTAGGDAEATPFGSRDMLQESICCHAGEHPAAKQIAASTTNSFKKALITSHLYPAYQTYPFV
ncbi:MAG: hypothetical protein DRH43_06785 [Deltaproteobacteria bacterium]|nr:MAG: hypothetical protein DRH43_06785 [Deltaproteobacteria bacterium]